MLRKDGCSSWEQLGLDQEAVEMLCNSSGDRLLMIKLMWLLYSPLLLPSFFFRICAVISDPFLCDRILATSLV